MITLRRITGGITGHFSARVSEWVMVYPCIGMAAALFNQHEMFQTSPSFYELARWLDEGQWAWLVLTCAFVRLIALGVNGTFARFPYSPHMRIAAASVSGIFWFQFATGFAVTAWNGAGAWSAVVMYSTCVLLEGINIWRSSVDLGRARR